MQLIAYLAPKTSRISVSNYQNEPINKVHMDKKNRLMAFVSIAAMLTGCAKEALGPTADGVATEDNSDGIVSGPVSVVAGLPGADTKTSYTYDDENKVMKVAWEKGDKIFSLYSWYETEFTQDGEMTGDGKFASFTKTSGYDLKAGKTYLFSYPKVMGSSSTSGSFVLSGQTGSIDEMKNYDILTAKVTVASDGNIPEISFSRRVAWMKITGLDFGGGVNTSITKVYLNGKVFNDFLYLNSSSNFSETIKSKTATCATPASPVEIKDGKQTEDLYVAFFPSADAAKGDECSLTVTTSDNTTYQVVWETSSAYTAGMMYALTGNIEKVVTFNIEFKDPNVKKLLTSAVSPADINGDGEISNVEAGIQTSLAWLFEGTGITSFDEFVYFTGVTRFDGDNSGDNGGFKGCTKLESIKLPSSITEIGPDAFNGCESLKAIEVPSSVKMIKAGAFKNCTSLESVSLPDGITYMGEGSVFYGCSALKTVHWPKSCNAVNTSSFQNCTSLETVELPEDLQTIGLLTFSGCHSLKSLTLPASVTQIGIRAFNDCVNLTGLTFSGSNYSLDASKNLVLEGTKAISCLGAASSITIAEDVTELSNYACSGLSKVTEITVSGNPTFGTYVFANNTALKKVTLGSACTSTGNYTFSGCTSLAEVNLPDGITTLGINLFAGCESLRNITLPASITTLNKGVFSGCTSLESVAFPSGMTKIPDEILQGCAGLKNVDIAEGITEIGSNAFNGCSGISSFKLPSTITKIGLSAFKGCTGLTSIVLPEGVTTLGNSVFDGCTGLTEMTIPETVTTLGSNLFKGCSSLVNITLPSKITTIPAGTFQGTAITTYKLPETLTSIPNYLFSGCEKLESIEIPENVKSIGTGAFEECTLLKTVKIPDLCASIGSGAFSNSGIETIDLNNVSSMTTPFKNCKSLKSIGLGKVKKLNTYEFQGCSSLTSITIPATVTKIQNWAFTECSSLKEVIMENATPCTIYGNAFAISAVGVSPITYVDAIYVPDSAVATYKATGNWATYYASYIFAISTR